MSKFMAILGKFFKKIPKPLRSKKALVVLVAVLVALFILTRGGPDQKQIKISKVLPGTIKTEVLASGKVGTHNDASLHFGTSGKVGWVGVEKGDTVNAWQALASLDREEFEIALRQAQQDVLVYDAELDRVYDDISKWSGAESFQNRIKRTTAEADKNKAFDAVKEAERDLRNATLTAPFAGTVIEVDMKPGEEVISTKNVVRIADLSNIIFKAEVDEVDVGKISEGQTAKINLDAFESEEFESSIAIIGKNAVSTSTGATAYEAEFAFPDTKDFRLGMSGEAKILIDQKENVLSIPLDALIDEKYIWVKKGNDFEKREVKVGISSDLDTEVLSGLEEGDEIMTAGFDQINKKSILQKIIGIFLK